MNRRKIVPRTVRFSFILLWLVSITLFSYACSIFSKQGRESEDTTYLTPIPEETLLAYREDGSPVETKLQAVIVAQMALRSTRVTFLETPEVVSVEALSLEEAHQRIERSASDYSYEDRPGDTPVWLVMFKGYGQMIPPDPEHTITPDPPHHGCGSVILQASDGGRSEIQWKNCEP